MNLMSDRDRSQSRGQDKEQGEEQASAKIESEADLEALDYQRYEIDEVREDTAEEFVKNYVQKGGE